MNGLNAGSESVPLWVQPDSTVALHVLAPPRYFAVMLVARVALGLDVGDVVPLYVGDDITDDAFRARSGRGSGVFVGQPGDPKVGDRRTSAAFMLDSIEEVRRFLDIMAR
jgi:trehalose-6-phosphatase